jgi:hypothetical protein
VVEVGASTASMQETQMISSSKLLSRSMEFLLTD